MAAVKENGHALSYASKQLRNDKNTVMEAVKNFGASLEYASEQLKNDKDIVMEAVKENGYSLEYANENLRNDKDIILSSLNNIRDAEHIKYLFSDDIKKLINGLANVEDIKTTLKTEIEKEQLNNNITITTHKTR